MKRIGLIIAAVLLWALPARAQVHTFQADDSTWNEFVTCVDQLQPCTPYQRPPVLTPLAGLPACTVALNGNEGYIVTDAQVCAAGIPITGSGSSYCLALCQSGVGWVGASGSSTNTDNVLNVLAPPYNAKGNGTTDDTAAIQQAIWDATTGGTAFGTCTTGVHKTVYLPKPATCYLHSQPIRVTCSNFELKGDDGASGVGASPLCQNYTGDAIIEGASGTGKLPFTSALVGTGNSLVSAPGHLSESIDLARMLDGRSNLFNLNNWFATGFNISFFMKATASGGQILSSANAYPGTGNGAFLFNYNGSNEVAVSVNLVSTGLHTFAACPAQTLSTVYEVEADWDGTTYRIWQGTPNGTATLCDSFSSTNRITQGIFEEIMLPDGAPHQYWPDGSSNQSNAFTGDIDSIRFEQASVHTSAYTVPNAKSTEDFNTVLLENWPTSPDGSQIALINAAADFGNFYAPVLDLSAAQTANINIHDLELCSQANGAGRPDGLFADAVNGARWTNLSCEAAYYSQFDAFQNDYYSNLTNWSGFGGHIGLNLGAAWNDSVTSNAQIDSVDGACVVNQGGGGAYHTDDTTRCTDRGALTYGWINNSSSGIYKDPYIDQEVGNSTFVASLLQNQPVNSTVVLGGVLSPGTTGVYVKQDNGGTGTTFQGTIFQPFGSPAEILDYTNGAPTAPSYLSDTTNPSGVALSNDPQHVFLNQISDVPLASLPACTAALDGTGGYIVTDATACAAGTLITSGGSTYCSAICKNGTGWVGSSGNTGAGTVTSIATTSPITGGTITGTGTIGLSTVGPTLGGSGLSNPTVHDLLVAEGSSNFNLLNLGADTFLQGVSSADPQAGSLPNCANDGAHALVYSTSTHALSCASISVNGQAIFTHTLTGATPTAVVNSTSIPATDVQNYTLGANCTSFTLPGSAAVADGEVLHIKIVQPSGSHSYTFPSTLTGGSGTQVAFMATGGCASMPSMPTGTGHTLLLDVVYNANTPTPTYDIVSCPTDGS